LFKNSYLEEKPVPDLNKEPSYFLNKEPSTSIIQNTIVQSGTQDENQKLPTYENGFYTLKGIPTDAMKKLMEKLNRNIAFCYISYQIIGILS
jgi:hypothetical protein